MQKLTLSNGINLIIEQMPNTHSITVGLYIKSGRRYEQDNFGITHLLEHLHFRQLGGMSQNELYYNMESIGSTLRATTYYDFLRFSMKIRPMYLDKCIDIFKEIISADSWTNESFNKEKEVVKNQIYESNYKNSENAVIRESIFGNFDLSDGIMGSLESVNAITLPDIISYKKRVFNSNNLAFCITGNISDKDIEFLSLQLSALKIPTGEKEKPIKPKLLYKRNPNIVFDHNNWDITDVNISFDIDYDKCSIEELQILNCILGEGVGSWLQKNIRENLNYTSDIFSETELYEDFALLNIKFSVRKENFFDCLSQVFKTVSDLKYKISKADLDVSLPFYTENLEFLQDDTEQMNFNIAYNDFVLNKKFKAASIKNDKESILRLINVAKSIFTSENMSVIVFGNCNRLTKKSIKEMILSI